MQLEFLIRLILATICGGLIGYERKSRLKEAGMRTHIIVALGSCLIMILSKYGFEDVTIANETMKVDAARLAAQVVSGVGFLGAGMILIRKNIISGLTTAAGIWTTSAIGLAMGAGMYLVGIYTTLLIVAVQSVLHWSSFGINLSHQDHIVIQVRSKADIQRCNQFIEECGIKLIDFRFSQREKGEMVELNYYLVFSKSFTSKQFILKASELDYILSVDM